MSIIDQKEYLKKYLGFGGDGKKKKKKKSKKTAPNRLMIIDHDTDAILTEQIKADLEGDNEDAPQIVSVIDERPPSLRIDEVSKDKLWTPVGFPNPINEKSENVLKFEIENKPKLETKVKKSKSSSKRSESTDIDINVNIKKEKSEDISPPRRGKNSEDISPPRRGKNSEDISPPRRGKNSEDISPPRRGKNSEDVVPLRKIKREPSEDNSPPRQRSNRFLSKHDKTFQHSHSSPSKRKKREKSEDSSPQIQSIKKEKSIDLSPQRRNIDSDSSPPRRKRKNSPSPLRKKNISPRRERKENNRKDKTKKKSRWEVHKQDPEEDKLKKTLDGKKAGLQNAKDLIKETSELRKREDELFKKMSAEVSGANAATVVRGKKKDIDWEEEERKRKKEEENKEKYHKWGKGLKQVEDANEKIKNDIYEMSKPLARYADDEDLEKYLKEQEREGDPMLKYIRQKKKKKNVIKEGKPLTQQYEGDAPANRFAIRPGYRWDGVDRSNGYEKKWFEVQNSQQASVEESYKWSIEDM
ncbi:BUD13 homolog [Euwallacea fornicatus]|uniref:BUD13 homolog n=1 Tax=Euwallacea fornicatus TaxID=995702 RepID=UPI00338FD5EC